MHQLLIGGILRTFSFTGPNIFLDIFLSHIAKVFSSLLLNAHTSKLHITTDLIIFW
jgi:hypothetical protein